MFRNVYYNKKTSKIHLWETTDGERKYKEFNWVPYVYTKTNEDTGIKSIYGDNVKKKTFNTWSKYRDFCNNNHNGVFEDHVKPEIQFLAEHYSSISDEEMEIPALKIAIIDIEVFSEGHFPDKNEAEDPIVAISVHDTLNDSIFTFGLHEYTGDNDRVHYFHCKNEMELLRKFFEYMHKSAFDIITGWYIFGFDIPYLYNRSIQLFGESNSPFYRISPINTCSVWEKRDGSGLMFDFAGVSILDYIEVYKRYTERNLESHRLDYVAKVELEKGKLDYSEYENLTELYYNDWNKYIDYNIKDVYRIKQLEDVLGYLSLVQQMSLLTKCPMKFYDKVTSLIEGVFLVYYRRNNLCAPKFEGGQKEPYDAAYVKEPNPGFYNWVVDLDVTSQYPTAMITLNMSNETYYGKINDISSDKIIEYTRNREFPEFTLQKGSKEVELKGNKLEKFNKALQKGLFSVAPNGVLFLNDRNGIVATVEKTLFWKRDEAKAKKKEYGKKVEKCKDEDNLWNLKSQKLKYDTFQLAIKNVLNSIYGSISVPYFRMHNLHIAEAITACGRNTIKTGEMYANEIMNAPTKSLFNILNELGKTKDNEKYRDHILYVDTDSLMINIGQFIDDHLKDKSQWNSLSNKEKENYVIRISKEVEEYTNNCCYNRLQLQDFNSQVFDFKTEFKQELVAPGAIFVKKKKYACWITNKEGEEKDELLVKGLELIQSSTPEAFKDYLRETMYMILTGEDEEKIADKIREIKTQIYRLYPEEIAINVGVSKLNKYLKKDGPIKGTPFNARSVYNYRWLRYYLNIENLYENIVQGEKVKIVYVKPNFFNLRSIAFKRWPKEFNEHGIEVDYDTMFKKHFTNKIQMLLKPAGMEDVLNEQKNVLNTFF